MNAIDFLIHEHNSVRKILSEINVTEYEIKRKRFDLLAHYLIRHETMEHTIWYPHFIDVIPNILKCLLIEEQNAEINIKKLNDIKNQDTWEELFLKFKTEVEHHINDEESKLFPEVKKLLSNSKLEEIGVQMYEYKENLLIQNLTE